LTIEVSIPQDDPLNHLHRQPNPAAILRPGKYPPKTTSYTLSYTGLPEVMTRYWVFKEDGNVILLEADSEISP
jgi:hypothetical protein